MLKGAIERCEALLGDLAGTGPLHILQTARSELLRRNLLGPLAHAPPDVVAVKADRVTLAVHAADNDVRVRVVGVVVIDRGPLEGLAYVALDLGHQPPHVQRHVQVPRILRRDDEPELLFLMEPRLLQCCGGDFAARTVEAPGPSVALDAIALDVPDWRWATRRWVSSPPGPLRFALSFRGNVPAQRTTIDP